MIVDQIWTANRLRNFNYLVACGETGEALAIDPLDHERCLRHARERGWEITQILNTHEHGDHIGGNEPLRRATGARVLAHAGATDRIPDVDRGLAAGDVVAIGRSAELRVLDTPGHTMSHVCLFAEADGPALFCGDTLFNAGAGNCHNGGHPNALYDTFAEQLERLPAQTRIYPGHDYIENNLRFTLDREPENDAARALLADISGQDPADPRVTDLATEREVNSFFRLRSPALIAHLREAFPDLPAEPDPRAVFLKLRELRNRW